VVLIGHHPVTLCGLRQVFENESDCLVRAVCTDVERGLEAVRQQHPDVLIADLDRTAALSLLRYVQRERLTCRVVILISASDEGQMVDATRLGAAIVQKELAPEVLVSCIRNLDGAERVPASSGRVSLAARHAKPGTAIRHSGRALTPREAEIARLAARGASTRDIATRLDVKQGTVKIHLHSIYEKLNVGGRLGLILVARRRGLA